MPILCNTSDFAIIKSYKLLTVLHSVTPDWANVQSELIIVNVFHFFSISDTSVNVPRGKLMPLQTSAMIGDIEIMKLLIRHGAKVCNWYTTVIFKPLLPLLHIILVLIRYMRFELPV